MPACTGALACNRGRQPRPAAAAAGWKAASRRSTLRACMLVCACIALSLWRPASLCRPPAPSQHRVGSATRRDTLIALRPPQQVSICGQSSLWCAIGPFARKRPILGVPPCIAGPALCSSKNQRLRLCCRCDCRVQPSAPSARMTARLLRPASSAAAVGRPAAAASLPRVHPTLGCCAAPVAIPLGFGSLRGSLAAARRLQYRVLSVVAQAEAGQPSQQPSAGAEAAEEQQEQAVETEELCIVNFYHLVDIKRPHEVRRSHCSQRQQPCPALLHAS